MAHSYPTKEQLEAARRAKEPTMVDQMKNAWDDFQAAGANSFSGANSEAIKRVEERGKIKKNSK